MKMLFLAPVLACSLAFGADVIAKDANITLDGKMIGKIEVLTPVEVVEKGDKTSKIKVSGVVSANYLAQLQRSVEDPEVFVAFDNESEANFKKVKDLEDDYGEVWYQADGVYEVPNDALGGNQKERKGKENLRRDLLGMSQTARAKQLYSCSVASKFIWYGRCEICCT